MSSSSSSSSANSSSSSSSSSMGGCPIPDPDVYYNAEEQSSVASLLDQIGSLNLGPTGSPPSTTGKYNDAREFSAGNNFSRISATPFNPGTSSAFAISLWFKPDATSQQFLFEKDGEYQGFFDSGKATFRIATTSTSGWDKTVELTKTFSTGTWYHFLVWIRPGVEIGIQVDGSGQTTTLSSGQAAHEGGGDLFVGPPGRVDHRRVRWRH